MKISITTDATAVETTVAITCQQLTPEIEKVIAALQKLDQKITGQKNGETFILQIPDLLYIDTANKKTFLYTKESVYETSLRLYELEEQLTDADFFRAGKSCIINFRQITSLKSDLEGRLRVTMSNGEQLIVSRQYTAFVKQKLGVK